MKTVNKKKAFEIMHELDAAGIKITYSILREALGGGSFSTLAEYIREWQAEKAAAELLKAEPPPEAIAEQAQGFAKELWVMALATAAQRFDADRNSLNAKIAELEADRGSAFEAADHAVNELQTAKERIAELEAMHAKATEKSKSLKAHITNQAKRASVAEARVAELEKRAAELAGLIESFSEKKTVETV